MNTVGRVTCIPGVVTTDPGQFRTEGGEEIEEAPGQDDDVVHDRVQHYYLTAVA